MALIVQKFGGTSVADLDRIRNVARRVARVRRRGHRLVVVVSAMAGETDRLIALAHRACETPPPREVDALTATGEQTTAALLAIALGSLGVPAESFQGFQARIRTDAAHTRARIVEIDAARIRGTLRAGKVAVVAGFQGVDAEGNVTTLGRGGSDLTAVALAAALGADACEIYTDVDGVYTTDPNVCPEARKLDRISYEEMLEMASLGAKVLQARSVEFAMQYRVPLVVRSSFSEKEGTTVKAEDRSMERVVVSGVTLDRNQAKITVAGVPDRPGIASRIFTPMAEAGISVDMIVQNVSEQGSTDLTFTVARTDFRRATDLVREAARQVRARDVAGREGIAKVSIVGAGMRSHAGVAARMFSTLAEVGVNLMMISTSEIKISAVVEAKVADRAVRALHEAFGLGRRRRAA